MAFQVRRGTDAQRQTITPLAGEPVFTSDKKELWIGDGTTPGGINMTSTSTVSAALTTYIDGQDQYYYNLSKTYTNSASANLQGQINTKQNSLGYTPEDVANKSTTTTLGVSNTLYPTQNAVKVYVDNQYSNSITYTNAVSGQLKSYVDNQSQSTLSQSTSLTIAASGNALAQANTYTNTVSGNLGGVLIGHINNVNNPHQSTLQQVTTQGATTNQTLTLTNAGTGLIIDGSMVVRGTQYVQNTYTYTEYVSGSELIGGGLTVNGDVSLGDNVTDTISLNGTTTYSKTPTAGSEVTNKTYVDNNDFWNRSNPTLTPRTSTDNVSLNSSAQTYAPLILTPQVATPTTQLVDGAIMIRNGQAWLYDATRSKWLSFDSAQWSWASNGNTDGVALQFGGNLANTNSGPRMLLDGTITGITAKSSGGNATKQIDIYINNVLNFSFNLVANVYSDSSRNVNFNAGDFLSAYVNSSGTSVQNLAVILYTKWRI